jgi:hypothetical protein
MEKQSPSSAIEIILGELRPYGFDRIDLERPMLTSIWMCICAVAEAAERLFADFADVPYQGATIRRQWEELLESSAERWRY